MRASFKRWLRLRELARGANGSGSSRSRLRCDRLEDRLTPGLCDLHPAIVDAPVRGAPGTTVQVATDVENLGSAASGSYTCEYRLSSDSTITSQDRLLKTVTRSAGIDGNRDDRWTETVGVPSDVKGGTYFVGLIVDPANRVREANEGNNVGVDRQSIGVYRTSLTGQVSYNGMTHTITIRPYGDSTTPIYTDRTTWVVIHGRGSSSDAANIQNLTRVLDGYAAGDQVLLLDWRGAAASGLIGGDGENFIKPVAAWGFSAMSGYGLTGSRLNVVGHSWGAYVGSEMAESFGEVNSIVALDAATDYPFGSYNPESQANGREVDFARNSHYSWAFFESGTDIFGSPITPLTADESFVVQGSSHSGMVNFFANLVSLGRDNAVGSRFRLERLLSGSASPSWSPNRYDDAGKRRDYGGWYEAVLTADSSRERVKSLRYFDGKVERTWLA